MAAMFPKINKKRYNGSVIGIPVAGSLVQTLVLWHSSKFRNVVLLAPTDRIVPIDADSTDFGSPVGLIFAGQCIRDGYWKYQGPVDIQIPPIVYTFVCAAHIYRGDDVIGIAGSQTGLMTLAVGGYLAVENEIAELLNVRAIDRLSEEQQLAKEIIRKHLSHLVQPRDSASEADERIR